MSIPPQPAKSKTLSLLICVFALVLFNWPILSIAGEKGNLSPIAYLFAVWLSCIGCLAFLVRYVLTDIPDEEPDQDSA